jgi:hypothetical protein
MTAQHGWNVDDWNAFNIDGEDNFEGTQYWLNFWRDIRLQRSHDYVLSALLPPACFVKHAE